MIRVFATPDGRARLIDFDDKVPAPPLELVQAFDDDQREEAWRLLHELGGQATAA